jgi:hypothetical protein
MTASPHKRTSGQPVRRGLTSRIGLQKGFTMGEIGLHSSNFDPLMSALGLGRVKTFAASGRNWATWRLELFFRL